MPESSASAARPVAAAAARALISALAAKVSPVSGGSSTSGGSGSRPIVPPSIRSSSRSLWSLRVASTRRTELPRDRGGLGGAQTLDADLGEREQLVEMGARQRRALRGRLHLHEAAVA